MKTRIYLILASILFLACNSSQQKNKAGSNNELLIKGKEITEASFRALSGQLQKALAEGGVQNAIKYCNIVASPLIDSLSKAYNVTIRRTSFNARNPQNRPTDSEKEVLIGFANAHKAGEKSDPVIRETDQGEKIYYQPIYIPNALCLNCHGNPGVSMSQEDYDFIQSLYPEDAATGYQEGDLRGMWVVNLKQ